MVGCAATSVFPAAAGSCGSQAAVPPTQVGDDAALLQNRPAHGKLGNVVGNGCIWQRRCGGNSASSSAGKGGPLGRLVSGATRRMLGAHVALSPETDWARAAGTRVSAQSASSARQ